MLIATVVLVVAVAICLPLALRIIKSIDKQAKKNSKKPKAQQGPFNMKTLGLLGVSLLVIGTLLRIPFVFWAGILFGILWGEEHVRRHPKFRKPLTALGVLFFVLNVLFIAAVLISAISFWLQY